MSRPNTRRARADLAESLAALQRPQGALLNGVRLTSAELIQRAAAAPIEGGDSPMPAGGLFDADAARQRDLFD